jgi:hypothetical protein
MNLGGSYDQAQAQAEGCDSFNRPKDQQAWFSRIIEAGSAVQHQA